MRVRIVVTDGPDKGRIFVFERRDRLVVGRSPHATFSVSKDPYFSRHHMLIEIDPPKVLLVDLESANGTFLNDQEDRVTSTPLHDGDVIRAGHTRLRLELLLGSAPDDTAPSEPNPATPPAPAVIRVHCLRCGIHAEQEGVRPDGEPAAYFCDGCRKAILSEPELFAGYRVVRELGRGGMGVVYLALEEATGQLRALKLALPHSALSEREKRMFLREASEQAKLRHPRIVHVFDLRELRPGVFCMTMEYVEGENAEDLLEREGKPGLPPQLAVNIVVQALEGLDFAHKKGVVHRDIKEANLIVRKTAAGVEVKLSDFGLAKSFITSGASGFTHAGDVAGTALYMAPEQILNFRDAQPPADLYAMGVTLYRLLTRHYPVDLTNRDPILTVLEDPIVPLRKRDPMLPASLDAITARALEKRPENRFASADEMRRALLGALP